MYLCIHSLGSVLLLPRKYDSALTEKKDIAEKKHPKLEGANVGKKG